MSKMLLKHNEKQHKVLMKHNLRDLSNRTVSKKCPRDNSYQESFRSKDKMKKPNEWLIWMTRLNDVNISYCEQQVPSSLQNSIHP